MTNPQDQMVSLSEEKYLSKTLLFPSAAFPNSLAFGTIPLDWKIEHDTQLFRKSKQERRETENCRPTTVISVVTKSLNILKFQLFTESQEGKVKSNQVR